MTIMIRNLKSMYNLCNINGLVERIGTGSNRNVTILIQFGVYITVQFVVETFQSRHDIKVWGGAWIILIYLNSYLSGCKYAHKC